MTDAASPRLRLFAGAALISLSPVWVKLVSVSPTTSGFYRVLIGGVALTLYLVMTRKRPIFSGRVWSLLALAGLFFALDLWFWHRSINYVGPGLSTLLANFQVFIMTGAGIVVLREMPRPRQLFAIPLALFGLALMGVAYVGMEMFTPRPPGDAMITRIWGASSSWTRREPPMSAGPPARIVRCWESRWPSRTYSVRRASRRRAAGSARGAGNPGGKGSRQVARPPDRAVEVLAGSRRLPRLQSLLPLLEDFLTWQCLR